MHGGLAIIGPMRLDTWAGPGGRGVRPIDRRSGSRVMTAADRHLFFGLLAFQNGIINQAQLEE